MELAVTPPPAKGEAGRGGSRSKGGSLCLKDDPTLALPLPGEGTIVPPATNGASCSSPPCQGGGWEGVSRPKGGSLCLKNDPTLALPLPGEGTIVPPVTNGAVTPPPAKGEAGRGSPAKREPELTSSD